MSNALAIAGVTAVLKDLLDSGLIDHAITDLTGAGVKVTSLPPDMVQIDGASAATGLNLFLYQVTHNAAWRNMDLPSRAATGQRTTNQPLALDLHYLLTAYGIEELQAEVLLGYGMQLLHENPVLARKAIRKALTPPSPATGALLPTLFKALLSADLAEQVEMLKITPATMGGEEMSRLWSALQAHYRPTAAFQVSVVLIEPKHPAISPLPVLTRGRFDATLHRDVGVDVTPGLVPPYPTLESASAAAHGTPSTILLGDNVSLRGHHLAGTKRSIVLRNDHFDIAHEILVPDSTDEVGLDFTVPALPDELPAGMYRLELRVLRSGDLEPRTSNALPVALAPAIVVFPAAPDSIERSGKKVTLTVSFRPAARVGQRVSLLLDSRETPAELFTKDTPKLRFEFDPAPGAGKPLLRLKVDGIESVAIDRTSKPPTFLASQRITLPA